MNKIRIDKWLWAVRIFKTRTLATQSCIGGKIKINGKKIKPSYLIKENDIISVRKKYINYMYKILNIIEKRVSAKIAKECIEDITPEEEKLKIKFNSAFTNTRTKGRPTKKDRRQIEKFLSNQTNNDLEI